MVERAIAESEVSRRKRFLPVEELEVGFAKGFRVRGHVTFRWTREGSDDVVLVFDEGLELGRREQLIKSGTPRKGPSRPFAWGAFELDDELTPCVRVYSLRMQVELEEEFCSGLR